LTVFSIPSNVFVNVDAGFTKPGEVADFFALVSMKSPNLPHVPLPFTKTNVLHYDLKKDAINKFGIKY
jgi:hypothetical protein